MILFINSYVWENRWSETYTLKELPDNKLEITFFDTNKCESKKDKEKFRIIFQNESLSLFKKDILENDNMFFKGVVLKQTSSNTFCVTKQESSSNRYMYALLKSNSVPDEIWIESSMKDRIKILKHILPADCEPDYGNYHSNIYLVRISLKPGEFLPIYFSSLNPAVLTKHVVIYRDLYDKEYSVEEYLQTFIPLTKSNKYNYTPMSSLD